jgi:hypothetical protein
MFAEMLLPAKGMNDKEKGGRNVSVNPELGAGYCGERSLWH